MELIIKQLLLMVLLSFSYGCFTPLVLSEYEKSDVTSSHILFGEEDYKGGYTNKDEIVLVKSIIGKYYGENIEINKFIITGSSDQYVMASAAEEVKIERFLPVYIESEVEPNVNEYIKIHSSQSGELELELKTLGYPAETFLVDTYYSKDPHYLKRSSLALALPVSVSLDAAGFCILTCISVLAGGPVHEIFYSERLKFR